MRHRGAEQMAAVFLVVEDECDEFRAEDVKIPAAFIHRNGETKDGEALERLRQRHHQLHESIKRRDEINGPRIRAGENVASFLPKG